MKRQCFKDVKAQIIKPLYAMYAIDFILVNMLQIQIVYLQGVVNKERSMSSLFLIHINLRRTFHTMEDSKELWTKICVITRQKFSAL